MVESGAEASVGRALACQAPKGAVGSFLSGVADRAPATLERFGQPNLLEVAGGQFRQGCRHRSTA
jgi:hypothetical protein